MTARLDARPVFAILTPSRFFRHLAKIAWNIPTTPANLNGVGILLALLLGAQTVYWDHDPGIVAPRVEEKNAPEYTAEARMARLEGSVQLTLMVDSDATVRDVHVTRPLGLGLDAKAVEAVREWKFTPGTKDGNPVPVLTRVDVNFRLLTARNDWHLNRA